MTDTRDEGQGDKGLREDGTLARRPADPQTRRPPLFSGFPGSAAATAMPNLFFSQLLPQIQRLEELIVTVYFFFAQGRGKGSPRLVSGAQMAADATLLAALANFSADPQAALAEGLALAVQRGTLLLAHTEGEGQELYLLNTPANRRALSRLAVPRLEEEPPAPAADQRPNIFALYEANIGAITPIIADELRDAEARYPWPWLEAAFHEAAAMNARSWRYIEAILRRYEVEGPDYEALGRDSEADARAKRPLSGRYRNHVRR